MPESERNPLSRASVAAQLFNEYQRSTGLEPEGAGPSRRYLWTDAHAILVALALDTLLDDRSYRQAALRIVDQAHHTLGRHRADDSREGWLSGLDEFSGEFHPTLGGLRIGKPFNERPEGEPLDVRLEWERDGQYFHDLTRWMHALAGVSEVTSDLTHTRWALELADRAFAGFVHPVNGGWGLHWKMSIDLSRPQLHSMGQTDPLDGYVTFSQLQAERGRFRSFEIPDLERAIARLWTMCRENRWVSPDPLGIGGLLQLASHMAALITAGHLSHPGLLCDVLRDTLESLRLLDQITDPDRAADDRLAFRELGLSLGLQAVGPIQRRIEAAAPFFADADELLQTLHEIEVFAPLGERIESFWLVPAHQQSHGWLAHADINLITLASSLVPDACLAHTLPAAAAQRPHAQRRSAIQRER